jgi:carbon storage regulator
MRHATHTAPLRAQCSFSKGMRIMLVLSRKVDEEIVIGNDIKVTVVRIAGNRIRLGITAPENVAIRRAEIAFDAEEIGIKAIEDSHANAFLSMC